MTPISPSKYQLSSEEEAFLSENKSKALQDFEKAANELGR